MRGRALDVSLNAGAQQAAEELKRCGFTASRADDVAAAALRYAEEETDELTRQLTPQSVWPGMVIVRRHIIDRREESYLMLKYEGSKRGWLLDAALFK